jgi:hypothetical protein
VDDSTGVSGIVSDRGDVGSKEGEINLVSIIFSCCASAVAALGAGLCAVVELGLVSAAATTGDGAFPSKEKCPRQFKDNS